MQYTLKEITVIWHLYGGSDFSPPRQPSSSSSPLSSSSSPASSPMVGRRSSKDNMPVASQILGRRRSNSGGGGQSTSPGTGRKHAYLMNSQGRRLADPVAIKKAVPGGRGSGPVDWKLAGGSGRDHSVLMEVELDKVCGWLWKEERYYQRLPFPVASYPA